MQERRETARVYARLGLQEASHHRSSWVFYLLVERLYPPYLAVLCCALKQQMKIVSVECVGSEEEEEEEEARHIHSQFRLLIVVLYMPVLHLRANLLLLLPYSLTPSLPHQ